MSAKGELMERARDELFSHINRCGVLQAEEEDQKQWMEETIEYLAERYPDLGDPQLEELFAVGMRFCRPAIPHGPEDAAEAPAGGEDDSPESSGGDEDRVETAERAR